MLVFALAAAFVATPVQGGDMTRNVLVDVCLPYVTGESSDTAALDFLGFVETPAPNADTRTFQGADEAHLLRMTTAGSAEEQTLNRVCVIQPRRSGLEAALGSVRPVMRQQGFTLDPEQPADHPIWTKGGVTVSLRQSAGAAPVLRVTFSSLDAMDD